MSQESFFSWLCFTWARFWNCFRLCFNQVKAGLLGAVYKKKISRLVIDVLKMPSLLTEKIFKTVVILNVIASRDSRFWKIFVIILLWAIKGVWKTFRRNRVYTSKTKRKEEVSKMSASNLHRALTASTNPQTISKSLFLCCSLWNKWIPCSLGSAH